MIGCNRVRNLISAYLDQELAGGEMLAIRRHLAGCAACEREYRATQRIKRLLGQLPEPAGPAVEWPGLERAQSLRAERQAGAVRALWQRRRRFLRAGVLTMACAVLLAMLAPLSRPGDPNTVVARLRPSLRAMLATEERTLATEWVDLPTVAPAHWRDADWRSLPRWRGFAGVRLTAYTDIR